MKIRSKIIYTALAVALILASCSKDFLNRPPLTELSSENLYQTPKDLKMVTAALYAGSMWSDWTLNSYLQIGEVMSGNMFRNWSGLEPMQTFAVTGTNSTLQSAWTTWYNVIIHCNMTINDIQAKAPATIPEYLKNAAIAEARFIRAYAYFNLAVMWGDVPIIVDNTKLISSPLVYKNKVEDVYKFAANDLKYAVFNLPISANDWEKGRVTSWSAQGMLAKVYLTWSGLNQNGQRNQQLLDSAKMWAGNVCKLSGLELMDNYADLFKTKYNDNPESLFALQWDPTVGNWLRGNMLQICSPGGIEISADGQAGWNALQPTVDIYRQYSAKDTVRRKATYMYYNDYYPELNAAGGGYTFTGGSGLKKHIIGTKKDNNAAIMTLTSSAEHNALLRLADVYLVYAEAILGNNTNTSDANALNYFNKVRIRAGVDPVITLNIDSLLKERRIELAGESQFWTDLVRLSYYNPQKAIDFVNKQERNLLKLDDNKKLVSDGIFSTATPATIAAFTFPIPSNEITFNPLLAEAPVPYSF